jgi:hypothetical protein
MPSAAVDCLCLLKTPYLLVPLNLPTETGRLWSP